MSEILRRAYEETLAAKLPPELEPAGFAALASHFLAASSPGKSGIQAQFGPATSVHDWPSRAAARMNLSVETLDSVFDTAETEPRLIVSFGRLPQGRAAATRTVALILAAARQGGEVDDGWTSTAILREACRDFGVLDQANFASHVTALDGAAFRGTGARREVKVTARGFELASQQIGAMAR